MDTYQQELVNTSTDILSDFEPQFRVASGGKRFANYIIDLIVFIVLIFALALIAQAIGGSLLDTLLDIDRNPILSRIATTLLFGLYMSVVETIFKGKSLGKLITGTRAVREGGSSITAKDAFGRGFSRCVPFEAFSALGSPSYPWHDKWTKTYVIDERKSVIMNRKFN